MSNAYLSWKPDQPALLPPAPQDGPAEDHLAYQVRDLIRELDLHEMRRAKLGETRGAPGFDPRMMAPILLYSWANCQ